MGLNSSFGEVNLDALDATIADNAVDIFIYDTSKDSDGGKWRKRTKKTSWYNETLNTATRGSRREFPAVAVIVASAAPSRNLYIYDGDDPDLPMWMVVDSDDGQWPLTETSSVYAVNGIIALGSYSSTLPTFATRNRLDLFHFISDKIEGSTNNVQYAGIIEGIANRRSIAVINKHIGTNPYSLVNYNIRSVAMTVLPSAPIDSATGLPVPTIIVCTGTTPGGAASIIKDDRTVSNITNNIFGSGYQFASSVFDNGEYFMACSSGDYTRVGIANVSTATHKYFITSPNIPGSYKVNLGHARKSSSLDEGLAIGGIYGANLYRESGLCLIKPDMNNFSAGTMHSHITSTYNTGYQVGDIKGAFLSDTDATNVTGTELVTNGTFDTDISGWFTVDANNTITRNGSGQAEVYRGGSPNVAGTLISMTSGVTYVITANILQNGATNNAEVVRLGTTTTGYDRGVPGFGNKITGIVATTYTPTADIDSLWIYAYPGNTTIIDDISVRVAELDRSVNNKGLQVFGTITKSAVATGAELVKYGNWSISNYLLQPYNSDLNFGTGDFYMMSWYKISSFSDHETIISREDREFDISILTNGEIRIYARYNSSTLNSTTTSSSVHSTGVWNHVAAVFTEGNTCRIYVNGNLVAGASTHNYNITGSNSQELFIGVRKESGSFIHPSERTEIALTRVGGSAPSPEQIKKIYEDEKVLFRENAACTLYGSSDVVTALAYDDKTNLLHVGTSSGRSDFRKLRRINNTTTGITTAISASNKLIAEQ